MHVDGYRDLLAKAVAELCRLDSGWRPGTAELEGARCITHFTILPPKSGEPLKMIALSSGPTDNYQLIVTRIFDLGEGWARTLDEWVVIGNPPRTSSVLDPNEIRLKGMTWLRNEIQRVAQSAARSKKLADGSMVSRQIREQFVELRRTCH